MDAVTVPHRKLAEASHTVQTHAVENSNLNDVVEANIPVPYCGTDADKLNMLVQGKQQELRRNSKLPTKTGFAITVVCAR